MDDASDTGATVAESNVPQNVYDLAAERALSSFDHRHRFVGNAIYAFPDVTGGPELLRAIGSGCQLNGIVTLQSGSRFTPILGDLLSHTNFDTPNRTLGTANFGRIFSAEPAREMQFGIKLLF
jgi:hypothetical protein